MTVNDGDRYVVGSTSTLYVCGHAEYQLRRADRPGATTFLGWPDQAATFVDWLNAQPPITPGDGDITDDYLGFTFTRRLPCGHREYALYRAHRPGSPVFSESSDASAARLLDWLDRHHPHQPRTEEDAE